MKANYQNLTRIHLIPVPLFPGIDQQIEFTVIFFPLANTPELVFSLYMERERERERKEIGHREYHGSINGLSVFSFFKHYSLFSYFIIR